MRHWIPDEDEPDWYDQQLCEEEDAEHRRMAAWVDSLTDDELQELQQARSAASAGRDLRAELTARPGSRRTDEPGQPVQRHAGRGPTGKETGRV